MAFLYDAELGDMQKMKIAIIAALSMLLPCIAHADMEQRIKETFSGEVIVLLAEELNPESHSLRLQDYVANGKAFIPVFTSQEKAKEAFGGNDPDRPMIAIKGGFFAFMMKGTETIKINPSLSDELVLPSADILRVMKEEVEALRVQFSEKQNG